MITIGLLKNHPEFIPKLADIWHSGLGQVWVPDIPLEYYTKQLGEHLNEGSLPLTIVAFYENHPVGICSLRSSDDDSRPDLTPWLGSLVVDFTYQNKGVGKMLVESIKYKAKKMGFTVLYLSSYLPVENYYLRLGWQRIDTHIFKGHTVAIMEIAL